MMQIKSFQPEIQLEATHLSENFSKQNQAKERFFKHLKTEERGSKLVKCNRKQRKWKIAT